MNLKALSYTELELLNMHYLLLVFLVYGFQLSAATSSSSQSLFENALVFYNKGLQGTSYQEQNQAFNHSLILLDQAAQISPSASIFQLMGDCYFQLGEYAWSILYYQRALKLNPQDLLAFNHLAQAQKILQISETKQDSLLNNLRSFYPIFWASTISLLGACLWLIFPSSMIKKSVQCIWGFTTFLWFVNFFAHFFSPVTGILVHPSHLFASPSTQSSILDHSLSLGSQVKILQMTSTGEWLKIQTEDQTNGYVPITNIYSI